MTNLESREETMTDDELQLHIGAIRELLREGRIQRRIYVDYKPKNWNTTNTISLDPHPSYEYRIAPQPLECWAWQYDDGSYSQHFHSSENEATLCCGEEGHAVRMVPAEDKDA